MEIEKKLQVEFFKTEQNNEPVGDSVEKKTNKKFKAAKPVKLGCG